MALGRHCKRSFPTHDNKGSIDLIGGSIAGSILRFSVPIFLGQLLQMLYNLADAWVIGNFADNNAFAAVSTMGTVVFLIIGFSMGLSAGGSVVISRYFGAGDKEKVSMAIHTNYLLAVIISIAATILGLTITPHLLVWIGTPSEVIPYASVYLKIYFGGISTVIFYNIAMSVMRALGDSIHPLIYLAVSSSMNVILDLLFVAHPAFHWGVAGAAAATVISQGTSALLCIGRQLHMSDYTRLQIKKIRFIPEQMKEVVSLGLPSGVQNAVLTIGNLVVQKNVNSFGTYAMSGFGAYVKIESVVFLPILAMSMSIPTFISQNLGAARYDRAKKGAAFCLLFGVATAQLIGFLTYLFAPDLLGIFTQEAQAIKYGTIHSHIVPLFYCVLAFAHCAAGIMRGCGKAVVPMVNMLVFWCIFRIIYVTLAVRFHPVFQSVSWAYPITWSLTDIIFLFFLLKTDWVHNFEKRRG